MALVGVRGEGDRSYPNRVFYSRISVHTALKYSPIRQGLAVFLPWLTKNLTVENLRPKNERFLLDFMR